MLPRPCLFALVAFERIERDYEHALRAFGPKPNVDVVQRAGGGGDAERRRHPRRKAIEIVVGAERLSPVGCAALDCGVQIDHVEVGGVRERMAAWSAKAEDHQLAIREATMGV